MLLFLLQLAGLEFEELCTGCLWVFSFQWPSRGDEEEAGSEDLEFVIDLSVNPGKFMVLFHMFICKSEQFSSSEGY